jgi:hypothetical protein
VGKWVGVGGGEGLAHLALSASALAALSSCLRAPSRLAIIAFESRSRASSRPKIKWGGGGRGQPSSRAVTTNANLRDGAGDRAGEVSQLARRRRRWALLIFKSRPTPHAHPYPPPSPPTRPPHAWPARRVLQTAATASSRGDAPGRRWTVPGAEPKGGVGG